MLRLDWSAPRVRPAVANRGPMGVAWRIPEVVAVGLARPYLGSYCSDARRQRWWERHWNGRGKCSHHTPTTKHCLLCHMYAAVCTHAPTNCCECRGSKFWRHVCTLQRNVPLHEPMAGFHGSCAAMRRNSGGVIACMHACRISYGPGAPSSERPYTRVSSIVALTRDMRLGRYCGPGWVRGGVVAVLLFSACTCVCVSLRWHSRVHGGIATYVHSDRDRAWAPQPVPG